MAAPAADGFRGLRGPPSGSRPPHRLVSPQNRLLVLLAPVKGPEGRLVAAEAGRKAGEVSRTVGQAEDGKQVCGAPPLG